MQSLQEGALEPELAEVAALDWLARYREQRAFEIERISFEESREWSFVGGALRHTTGKFFSIEGVRARSQFPGLEDWSQPIINQPEVGFLGFLAQRRQGAWRLLVQAKAEPGNEGIVQLAPTLQATKSNYTQAHRGDVPCHLDRFLHRPLERTLVDQLQSEQGSRFLRKRNRNIVLEVPPGQEIEHSEAFRWISLREIHSLLRLNNVVNTDSRSVISSLPMGVISGDEELSESWERAADFEWAVLESLRADESQAGWPIVRVLAWMTDLRMRYGLKLELLPLDSIPGWSVESKQLAHESGRHFSVIQLSVWADDREVRHCDQPLVNTAERGLIAFVCQHREGVLHFLVQARVEPGCFDVLELTTSVQCVPSDLEPDELDRLHPLASWVMQVSDDRIRFSNLQSEEGGRFFHDANLYLVVEAPESEELDLPENYCWLTLAQIEQLMLFNNVLTNEARSLLACLRV